jgi:hypothetical protein
MTNLYAPPKTDVASSDNSPPTWGAGFWVAGIIAGVVFLLLGLMGAFVVPAFEDVFSSFGADLPALTLVVMSGRHALWLGLLLVVVVWGVWYALRDKIQWRSRFLAAFIVLDVLGVVAMVAVIWSLYLPIFVLGTVTSG